HIIAYLDKCSSKRVTLIVETVLMDCSSSWASISYSPTLDYNIEKLLSHYPNRRLSTIREDCRHEAFDQPVINHRTLAHLYDYGLSTNWKARPAASVHA